MIERMKYVNIMGPLDDLDRVVEKYISKYEIQLEYTLKELTSEKGLVGFSDPNPYTPTLRKAEKLVKMLGIDAKVLNEKSDITMERNKAINIIRFADDHFETISKNLNLMIEQLNEYKRIIAELTPYRGLDFHLEDMSKFNYVKFQSGKMPLSSFKQFEKFLYNDPEILFVNGSHDENFLWGIYFATENLKDKADSVFSSLHFQKLDLPMEVNGRKLVGTPNEVCLSLSTELDLLEKSIADNQKAMLAQIDLDVNVALTKKEIISAYQEIKEISFLFDIRKYAAKTVNDFYIFVGWMSQTDAAALTDVIKEDASVVFIVEDDNEAIISSPPTKLKNAKLFRPFEFFVKMYGLPSYDELDPTAFVAVTYTLLFGVMFGDLGQGFVLALLGLFLWKSKSMALGKVMLIIGASSMFFGALFGSVFGYEFEGLWTHPAAPENANFTLIVAVGVGIGLIIIAMLFNIVNGLRRKKLTHILFDPNGFAGILFYVSIVVFAAATLLKLATVAKLAVIILLVIPTILIALREPLIKLIHKRKGIIEGGIPLFFLETFIELFEVMLGYFTNTVSFVRVGAFALSHASMMGVVWMLSKTANGSNNIAVVIFGNLLVIALEGLIVGIQVLRLEFYEMFSRFYEGAGREFIPYHKSIKNKY